MKGSLNVGRIAGIPIRLHVSWFLVAVLITWSLAAGYFPLEYPGWQPATYLIVGVVTAVLFFASVLLHELGHSVVALREGVPVKSITLFIFGGVAEIRREPETPGAEFRIAIAGPLSSLGLAALFGGAGALLADTAPLAAPLAYLARINLLLVAFNMIPGFPLDGGRVLRAALWAFRGSYRDATRWASWAGRGVALGLIVLGVSQMLLGGGLANGVWYVFIGWYLNGAAASSYEQVRLRDALSGVKARNVMTQECATVPGELGVDRLVEEHVLAGGQSCFFVADKGNLAGLLTLEHIQGVPRERRRLVTTGQVMTRIDDLERVHPEDDVWSVLERMDEQNAQQLPVIGDGGLLGMITREGLLRNIRLRAHLAA